MNAKQDKSEMNQSDKTLDNKPMNEGEEAPMKDKTTDAPEAEDFSTVIEILNAVDRDMLQGKGEITEIPGPMQGSLKYIIEQMVFLRDLFEDPLWKAIMDDLVDQKEDGRMPSILVAFARNVPMEKFEAIADNEDYIGAQQELADNMAMEEENRMKAEEEDAMFEEGFQASKAAGMEYAEEMGYDEAQTNELFQFMLDFYKIVGDGKLTKDEWSKVDKMRNYDKDMEDMRAQMPADDKAKEVLPDQASLETEMAPPPPKRHGNMGGGMKIGMESMVSPNARAYENVGTDVTQIGKRKIMGKK